MKIVLTTHHYPPTYAAGVELLTERLARWLAHRGHAVEVVCIEDIDTDGPLSVTTSEQDGVAVHRLHLKLTGARLPLGFRHADEAVGRWFTQYLAQTQPDLLHSQSSYLLTASLLDVAHRAGIPVVASLHDYWYFCPRITLLRSNGTRCDAQVEPVDCARCLMSERRRYRMLDELRGWLDGRVSSRAGERLDEGTLDNELVELVAERQAHLDRTLRSVDQIVTPALLTRELLLARGFAPEHVRLVRQGLQATRAGAARPEALSDGPLRVGYMGQLVAHKGVHLLVEAVRHLEPASRPIELVIYGDPSRFPKYVERLHRLAGGARNIHFGGTYDNAKVWEVLRDIDVLVVPSVWFEISPLVILEAFGAGVPVIVSDLRNMNYQVRDEVDGLVFPAGDATALRRQLKRLVDDPDLLAQLRKGIRPVYSVEAEMAEMEELYRSTISRSRPVAAQAER